VTRCIAYRDGKVKLRVSLGYDFRPVLMKIEKAVSPAPKEDIRDSLVLESVHIVTVLDRNSLARMMVP
jgi:hypothetical protein